MRGDARRLVRLEPWDDGSAQEVMADAITWHGGLLRLWDGGTLVGEHDTEDVSRLSFPD